MEFIITLLPAWGWLTLSGISFAFGEYYSKKFALLPGSTYFFILMFAYMIGVVLWLPALMIKRDLAIAGTLWSVISLLTTIAIASLIFGESVTPLHWIGISFALIAIILLNI